MTSVASGQVRSSDYFPAQRFEKDEDRRFEEWKVGSTAVIVETM